MVKTGHIPLVSFASCPMPYAFSCYPPNELDYLSMVAGSSERPHAAVCMDQLIRLM